MATTSLISTADLHRGADLTMRHRDALDVAAALQLARRHVVALRRAGSGEDLTSYRSVLDRVHRLASDLGLDTGDEDYDPHTPYVRSTDATELRRLERRVDVLEDALAGVLAFSPTTRSITEEYRAARTHAQAVLEDR